MDFETLSPESNIKFQQARRQAQLSQLANLLRGHNRNLLSFDEVRQKLGLRQSRRLGRQQIALDNIVGSVGRYQEFTVDFLPRIGSKSLAMRWRGLYDLANGATGFPPIQAFQVGPAYFVEDGNHRVSVARTNGAKSIEAYVTVYDTPADLTTIAALRGRLADDSADRTASEAKAKSTLLISSLFTL